MTTDHLESPAQRAVDRLLDELVPQSDRRRWDLDNAITDLVIDTMNRSIKRQGKVILAAIAGDLTSWRADGPQWPNEWVVDEEDRMQEAQENRLQDE
jgi:hypothetical protein